ncbi:MAG TPA: hypothetical protein DEB39_10650 [Planctomycetaceae bacterium]|nr:hypothetical protein [Planctomycetaceae bacterium]
MKTILIAALVMTDDDNRDENDSRVPDPEPNPLDLLFARLLYETKKGRNPDIWSIDPHGTSEPLDRRLLPALRAVGFDFKAFQNDNLE